MRPSRLVSAAGIALGLLFPSVPAIVAACSLITQPPLEIVANPSDQLPPSAPTVTSVKVRRGDEWGQDDGCFTNMGTSCDGTAYVVLHLEAQDETSPAGELGYLVETISPKFDVPAMPVRLDETGQLLIVLRGTDDGEDDLHATLQVFSVDKAGNVSLKPTPITISNEGSGCRIASNAPTGLFWTFCMLLTLVVRQRRRTAPAQTVR